MQAHAGPPSSFFARILSAKSSKGGEPVCGEEKDDPNFSLEHFIATKLREPTMRPMDGVDNR